MDRVRQVASAVNVGPLGPIQLDPRAPPQSCLVPQQARWVSGRVLDGGGGRTR
jgi:hypothetical protein